MKCPIYFLICQFTVWLALNSAPVSHWVGFCQYLDLVSGPDSPVMGSDQENSAEIRLK